MVPKCSITFATCSQLICPERPIPFHIPLPLQLKKKKNTLLLQVPSLAPLFSPSFIFPITSIISLFQICNLLFIFSPCLTGPASVHLIKMYIFKLFFKGKLFAKRTKAMPRVTGNYCENEHNKIAHHLLFAAVYFLCVDSETLCSSTAKSQMSKLYILSVITSQFISVSSHFEIQPVHLAQLSKAAYF